MNDEIRKLEDELRSYHPRRPSDALQRRIEEELNEDVAARRGVPEAPAVIAADFVGRGRFSVVPILQWAAGFVVLLGLAAAVVVLLHTGVERTATLEGNLIAVEPVIAVLPMADDEIFTPVSVNTILLGERDDGIVFDDAARPMRRVVYSLMDNVTWQNASSSRTFVVDRPRAETIYVAMEIY